MIVIFFFYFHKNLDYEKTVGGKGKGEMVRHQKGSHKLRSINKMLKTIKQTNSQETKKRENCNFSFIFNRQTNHRFLHFKISQD